MERNTHRAARTTELAVIGAEVRYSFPNHILTGKITRTTAASVFAEFVHPAKGNTVTVRFTQRKDGEFRKSGTGEYAAALQFEVERIGRDYVAPATPGSFYHA